jgi:hypothetical protein
MADIEAALHEALEGFAGKAVWRIVAGPPTGSSFTLAAGEKWRVEYQRRTRKVTRDIGEYALYVTCAWRLEEQDKVLCTWRDDARDEGLVVSALQRMVGRSIEAVSALPPAFDLDVRLTDDMRLYVFCEEPAPAGEDCYNLFSPTHSFSVGGGGTVSMEDRFTAETATLLRQRTNGGVPRRARDGG